MKHSLQDLAIFGGSPLFAEKLHVGRPNIGDRERFIERVNDMLDRRWLTNDGPYVQEFEKRICEITGATHAIALCNATIGLEIASRALELKGEVIVPSFTFIATAHALQWQEITPVFCDTAPNSHHLDPDQVERLITPRTTGIIGVHVWGAPCNVERLNEIAQRRGLRLMFDAAHAFGCSHNGTMIGNFGDAEVFSFHATKFLNSFEGGAVVTNNDELARKMRFMRNFGFAGYDDVDYVGTNGKMTEVCAAMGLSSLDCMDELIEINHRNYTVYQTALEDIPGISLYRYNELEKNNYQYIVIEVNEQINGISRDNLLKILHAENILVRRYFYPGCHQMEPYKSYFPFSKLTLGNTENLSHRVLSLPNGTSVSKADVELICNFIKFVVDNKHLISSSLK